MKKNSTSSKRTVFASSDDEDGKLSTKSEGKMKQTVVKKRKQKEIEKPKKENLSEKEKERLHELKLAKTKRRKEKKKLEKETKKQKIENSKIEPEEESEEVKEARNQIKHAKKSQNIFSFNKLISQFGNKKQLGLALDAFNVLSSAYKSGSNKRSSLHPTVYTFTNLINACVRCGETKRAKQFFKEMQDYGVQPNEVTYTALIKGLCGDASIEEAITTIHEMIKQGVLPNLRTYNTVLRGCLKCGDLDHAKEIFEEMKKERINPDVSSYEYMIKSYCQALDVDSAWELIEEMSKKNLNDPPGFSAIATASALTGDLKKSRKAIESALEGVKQSGGTGNDNTNNNTNSNNNSNSYNHSHHHQQQQSSSSSSYGQQDYGEETHHRASLPLFLKLRNEEVERECNRVKEYHNLLKEKKEKAPVLTFPDPSKVVFLPDRSGKSKGKIDFRDRFNNKGKLLKLEICSGHGDWIVEKAENDPKNNWVGLEMRYERVYLIWSKMVFKQLNNTMVVGGEAHAVLSQSIVPETFDEVFVNYPDPPVWEKSKQRLIDSAFLRHVHHALKPNCPIVLVTDDEIYSQQMVKEFMNHKELFRSAYGDAGFTTEVPSDYGSSYFDRLWTNGNKTTRYYMKYFKV